MPTALIIGASRGIGRELVRQYLADGWRVLATARKSEDCAALGAMGAHPYQLDVASADSIAALGWNLDGELPDAAFLNAGVYGPRHDGFPTQDDFDTVMHTNVLAALRLLPVIAPMVAEARGKLAVISSRMASMGARSSASGTLYRASKAALNSVLVDTAIRFGPKGATCVAFHPGWVQTDMGGVDADITPAQSAAGLRATLAGLDPAANGAFLNYDGTPLPW
ncbi:SDR family oxidoreductase [Massilia atriviolacea]|uniref:SDR family oxidoreductase n=1 Tax=Massilia atriviolacea TaxID=2495579 RepID=A0A430HLB5_9BURK|nr:SDR family oxidoreductase [Massilia atriviolacea]RSZ58292.1 SDR family oxidoreductase [Massilia atriviolacea]